MHDPDVPVAGRDGASPPASRKAKRWLAISGAGLAVLILLALVLTDKPRRPVLPPGSTASATADPWDAIRTMLQTQAQALMRGDEAGWLAAVDPSRPRVVDHYRQQFHTLQSLHVTGWNLWYPAPPIIALGGDTEVDVAAFYCFSERTCPEGNNRESLRDLPYLQQVVVVTDHDGKYRITDVRGKDRDLYVDHPLPWEWEQLKFLDGARVTVAAPASQAHRLGEVTAAADRAAATTDRIARSMGNEPPGRYVIFLAGDKEWKTWRGGESRSWAIGYTYMSGSSRGDVVLKMSAFGRNNLTETLRHEFGHIITHGNGETNIPLADSERRMQISADQWVIEGVAEYIAYVEQPVTATQRSVLALRAAVRKGHSIYSLQQTGPSERSSAEEADAFYAQSHLAMYCLASQYGETKMLKFAYTTIHYKMDSYDASRKIFGKDFKAVDAGCTTYIRRLVNA